MNLWAHYRGKYLSQKNLNANPPIWGILKLSVLLNQKILKLSYQNFQTVSKQKH